MSNPSNPATRPTVLVVDDEADIRDGSERILRRMDLEVLKAANGEEALAVLDQRDVDIMLLDLKMPGMEGMEVLDRLRQAGREVLVIVITGFATVETAIGAMKQGAYDFIAKPFDPDHLRLVVGRALETLRFKREAQRAEQARLRTLSDLDTEKSRIWSILQSLPDGVVVTNSESKVVLMNPAGRQLLGLGSDQPLGQDIERYLPDEQLCHLVREMSAGHFVDYEDIPAVEFAVGDERYLRARGQPVLGERRECLGAVLNIVEITAMKIINRLKSEFVAKVTHELRSPLSTIHEQLAVVLKELVDQTSPEHQHLLVRAKEKTHGLISMIGDLLDLSRIEEGAICREPKPVDVGALLADIVSFMRERAAAQGQELVFTPPARPLPQLTADPIALESIFGNLVANAIKYTQDGGRVRVTAVMAGLSIQVAVADNGYGIAEKHLDKIFERFYRVRDDKTRFITGTGLGLPIVKGLVEGLGGFITVESSPGVGSTFTVTLPVQAPEPSAAAPGIM